MERMNNLNKIAEKENFREDGTSSVMSDTDEDPSLRTYLTFREQLRHILESHKFQIGIIALVLLDSLIVITELILEGRHDELHSNIPHALHYMSITILSIFIIEILIKVYAFGLEFFRHKLEIFDACMVFLSFGLDLTFWNQTGVTLIIVLRLWRIVRILNGIIMSVKIESDHKLSKERQLKEGVEQELTKCRLYSNALEQEVETLRSLLKKHGIKEVPPSVVSDFEQNTISVVAEVNQILPV
ncbi:voltage-gated hydrogen channel 1 [Parasteatoda tepidariorum]|uniref:voltage-gated hydrogen channel 1 n=1 Tax=Parasteatoda tepidariorum TaxID=114398 RepID=UPI00077FDC07|nr:voltage-gated hydrogen channel 1 [Parasteatoda tepidariorum]XP_015919513.1 voltage-gated hydrogen channel 1 [Parasteatoda tepidariorum]XP_015919516.1 voltage-gated hydrogen channel 1 [Parasteatoda tepidariorum]XP_042900976.1 voltage-gated hydrogen channel 1 [Parasteatoda tepidariorum]